MIFDIFTPILGEMIQFDEHIFQMGWFNHQLVLLVGKRMWKAEESGQIIATSHGGFAPEWWFSKGHPLGFQANLGW